MVAVEITTFPPGNVGLGIHGSVTAQTMPIYVSQDTPADCIAAGITAGIAVILGIAWFDERKDSIEKQKEIEDEIHGYMADDDSHYSGVTFPQQIKAIQAGTSSPIFVPDCEDCYSSTNAEHLAEGIDQFLFAPTYAEDRFCADTVVSHARTGLAQAYHDDRLYDKELVAKSYKNRAGALAKAKSSMFIDHGAKYTYMRNASAIQGGLAGMAAQGYAGAVHDLNFALGVIGSPKAGSV